MKTLVIYASLLLTGIVSGWLLRGTAPQFNPLQSPASLSPSTSTPITTTHLPESADKGLTKPADPPKARETTEAPDAAVFEQLLLAHEFEQAVTYYEHAIRIDEHYQPLLKPTLEGYLRASLDQCDGDAFVELVGLWLDAYYDDIAVLLLLAENQRLCSSPEEAARTLQIARTYAIQPGAQISVTEAVARLITSTDETLSQQKNWIALLGFFEFLQAIDLATKDSELRRAALYQLIGENQRSQDLLLALREQDDGRDAQWTAALNLQWGNSITPSTGDDLPAQSIPLIRRGDHFLVPTVIDGGSQVVLMLDTGASVTILSRNSFEQMDHSNFRYRGLRLFNTPNGATQGEVYEVSSLALGNSRLGAIDIAVLDYESGDGIDGLLGMNVLRNYRFEIDQDRNALRLHPRP